jgi:hypothetical protein
MLRPVIWVFSGEEDSDMALEMMFRSCMISRTSGWTNDSASKTWTRGWEGRTFLGSRGAREPESCGKREKIDRLFHVEE